MHSIGCNYMTHYRKLTMRQLESLVGKLAVCLLVLSVRRTYSI